MDTSRYYARALVFSALFVIALASSGLGAFATHAFADATSSDTVSVSADASPTVVRELEASRTANTSTYLLSDKTYRTDIYSAPVHYKDERGRWQDINVSLVPTDTFGVTHTKASAFDETFASDDVTSTPFSISHGDWSVGMKLLGAEQGDMLSLGDTASYPLAMTDAKLTYQATPNGVKDTILLSSADAPDTYTFFVSMENVGLFTDVSGDAYAFVDSHGKIVGHIAPLSVFDSSAETSGGSGSVCTSATMSVAAAPGGAYVTYHVPRAWLDDPHRSFPVSIDPTYTWYGQDQMRADTYVTSGQPTATYGGDQYLYSGFQSSGAKNCSRTLIAFDDDQALASGVIIKSATLQLRCSYTSGSRAVYVYPITGGAWGTTSSWNSTFGNGSLTYDDSYAVRKDVTGTGNQTWDVTAALQHEYDTWQINGFLIRETNDNSSTYGYRQYYSCNYTGSSSYTPHLSVVWCTIDMTEPFIDSAYSPGDEVDAGLEVQTPSGGDDADNIQMNVIGKDASGNSVNRGRFIWTTFDPDPNKTNPNYHELHTSDGYWFTYDAGPAGDAVIPELDDCSSYFEAGIRYVHFVYTIGDTYGDIQHNRIWAMDCSNMGGVLQDTGFEYSVLPASPDAAPGVLTAASANWFTETAANGSRDDSATAGRGSITATWDPVPSASNYKVYLFDGSQYRLVGSTTTTGWSSAGKGIYPSDTAISQLTTGSANLALGPWNSPSVASRLQKTPLSGNRGVCLSDGTYAYMRSYYTYGSPIYHWEKYGTGLNGTVAGQDLGQVGPEDGSGKPSLCGLLLNGYLYSGYATARNKIVGVSKTAGSGASATQTITFSKPILHRMTSADLGGADLQTMLATDGRYIYSLAQSLDGTNYNGFKIRVFATDGTWISDYTVAAPSFNTGGLISDGTYLYIIEENGADSARVEKVSLINPATGALYPTGTQISAGPTWTIDQATSGEMNGCYDTGSGRFWMGGRDVSNLQSFSGPGLDLRDDPRPLYAKVTGLPNRPLAYFLKVVPSNSVADAVLSDCATLTVELDSRTKHLSDAPRHTTADLGDFFGDTAAVRTDEGDFTLSATDLSIPEPGPMLSVERFYRSSTTATSSLLAPGWRFSFERNIASTAATATYFDEEGDAHVFRNVAGTWISPHGDADVLTGSPSTGFILHHKDLSTTTFDTGGRLVAESDCNNNTVTYQWAADGSTLSILSPTDSIAQRRITVSFSNGKAVKAVAHITESGNDPNNADREVDYTPAITSLTVTKLPDTNASSTVVYGYDASNRISSVAVPGFTPSADDEAIWDISYPSNTSITVQNDTGSGTPTMPRIVSWSANSSGGTASVQSASGVSTLGFDPTGEEVSSTQENTSAATFDACDVEGNQIRETDPLGSVTSSIYDGRGNELSSTDEAGAVTTYVYDSLDRCVSQTDPSESLTTKTYYGNTTNLHIEEQTLNDAGQKSHVEYAYNSNGTTQWEKKAIDATRTLQTDYSDYAHSGDAQTTTQENVELSDATSTNIVTHTWVDGWGEAERQVDALNTTAEADTLDAAGRVTEATDANGTVSHTVYSPYFGTAMKTWQTNPASPTVTINWAESTFDGVGNVVTETLKASDGTIVSTTVHRYDAAGRETTSDASDVPGVAATVYDMQGNVAASWDEGAKTSQAVAADRSTYDADGQETTSTASGSTSASDITTYTPTGDVAKTVAADGQTTFYTYNAAGDLSAETVKTDAGLATTSYTEDQEGRTVSETDANGTDETTAYDLDDNVISDDGDGSGVQPAATTRVNVLGWVLTATDSDGVVTHNVYDADGRLTSSGVGGLTTSTSYDAAGKVLSQTNPDGTGITYSYDPFGRQTGVIEKHGATTIKTSSAAFDLAGKVATQTVAWPSQWPWGRSRVSTTAPDGTVSTTESSDGGSCTLASTTDGTGLLRSWTASVWGAPVDFSVDATDLAGRVVSATSPALSVSRTATFTDAGQLKRLTLGSASEDVSYNSISGKGTAQSFHFTFGGGRTETDSYTYDLTGRLVSANVGGKTTTYAYDPDTGALTGVKGIGATSTLTYETASPSNWTGHLLTVGSALCRSDANGHRVSMIALDRKIVQTSYEWSGDRLTRITGYSGTGELLDAATYTYDASGQRLSSVVTSGDLITTTSFDYDGATLLGLSATRSDGAAWKIRYLYDGSGKLFAGVYQSDMTSATPFAIETSDRGDVRELLAAGGASFALYSYDAYGNPAGTLTAAAGSLTATQAAEIASRQPLRYASYAYDAESGFYYCSQRYYDPAAGAFISKDSAKSDGEESAYQYCGGDPVGKSDRSGLDPSHPTDRLVLDVPEIPNKWEPIDCWEGADWMVLRYMLHNNGPDPAKIHDYASAEGLIYNQNGEEAVSLDSQVKILKHWHVSADQRSGYPWYSQVRAMIKNKKSPVIAVLNNQFHPKWVNWTGHSVVIKGYMKEWDRAASRWRYEYLYNDPYDGKGHGKWINVFINTNYHYVWENGAYNWKWKFTIWNLHKVKA